MTSPRGSDRDELQRQIRRQRKLGYTSLLAWAKDNQARLELRGVRHVPKPELRKAMEDLMPDFRAFYQIFRAWHVETTTLQRIWSAWLSILMAGGITPDESFDLAYVPKSEWGEVVVRVLKLYQDYAGRELPPAAAPRARPTAGLTSPAQDAGQPFAPVDWMES